MFDKLNSTCLDMKPQNASLLTPKEFVPRLIYLLLVVVATVFGNLLVIVAVAKFKKLRRSTNLILASLAMADLMSGIITVPLYIIWTINPQVFDKSGFLCRLVLLSCLLFVGASQVSLLVLSFERYLAVCQPFRHRSLIMHCPWIHKVAICFIWMVSAITTATSSLAIRSDYKSCSYYGVFDKMFLFVAVLFGIFVMFLAIIVINVKVLCSVRDHEKQLSIVGEGSKFGDHRDSSYLCHQDAIDSPPLPPSEPPSVISITTKSMLIEGEDETINDDKGNTENEDNVGFLLERSDENRDVVGQYSCDSETLQEKNCKGGLPIRKKSVRLRFVFGDDTSLNDIHRSETALLNEFNTDDSDTNLLSKFYDEIQTNNDTLTNRTEAEMIVCEHESSKTFQNCINISSNDNHEHCENDALKPPITSSQDHHDPFGGVVNDESSINVLHWSRNEPEYLENVFEDYFVKPSLYSSTHNADKYSLQCRNLSKSNSNDILVKGKKCKVENCKCENLEYIQCCKEYTHHINQPNTCDTLNKTGIYEKAKHDLLLNLPFVLNHSRNIDNNPDTNNCCCHRLQYLHLETDCPQSKGKVPSGYKTHGVKEYPLYSGSLQNVNNTQHSCISTFPLASHEDDSNSVSISMDSLDKQPLLGTSMNQNDQTPSKLTKNRFQKHSPKRYFKHLKEVKRLLKLHRSYHEISSHPKKIFQDELLFRSHDDILLYDTNIYTSSALQHFKSAPQVLLGNVIGLASESSSIDRSCPRVCTNSPLKKNCQSSPKNRSLFYFVTENDTSQRNAMMGSSSNDQHVKICSNHSLVSQTFHDTNTTDDNYSTARKSIDSKTVEKQNINDTNTKYLCDKDNSNCQYNNHISNNNEDDYHHRHDKQNKQVQTAQILKKENSQTVNQYKNRKISTISFGKKQSIAQADTRRKSSCVTRHAYISKKVVRTVTLVCASFILAWLPFFVVIIYNTFCTHCVLDYALNAVLMVAFGQSAFNPIIYALYHASFRRAYQSLIRELCSKKTCHT